MNMINILEKIENLKNEKGWSIYKLAEEAGITQSTLANLFARKSIPSIKTLEQICNAFNITLAEFFAENLEIEYIEDISTFKKYKNLDDKDKELIKLIIKKLLENKKPP